MLLGPQPLPIQLQALPGCPAVHPLGVGIDQGAEEIRTLRLALDARREAIPLGHMGPPKGVESIHRGLVAIEHHPLRVCLDLHRLDLRPVEVGHQVHRADLLGIQPHALIVNFAAYPLTLELGPEQLHLGQLCLDAIAQNLRFDLVPLHAGLKHRQPVLQDRHRGFTRIARRLQGEALLLDMQVDVDAF
ncbi:hypothetical protein D3C71_1395800 [compost metagenome]